jgi:sec-independent protein translocase protein TatA
MLADVFGLDAIWAIVIIAILLFGGAAIPKLARSLGSAKTQFEKGLDEGKKAGTTDSAATDTPAPSAEEKTPGV